jgi:hypothetical protein
MPSPFPGMDPYLEEPSRWGGVHSRLINAISDDLADQLAPHFFVEIEERVYIVSPEDRRRVIVPDVFVVTGPPPARARITRGAITAPTLIEPLDEPEIRDRFIEIRDATSREVVTTIEVVSPFIKTSGVRAREAFLDKRARVMASPVHWIEIDLLRAGERPIEVAGQSDYYALLRRTRQAQPRPFEVWFIDLRDPLPTIAVPLRPPFEEAALDLQAALDTVYARAHYADSLDYDRSIPPPALLPADAAWAEARVQAWRAARATPPGQ